MITKDEKFIDFLGIFFRKLKLLSLLGCAGQVGCTWGATTLPSATGQFAWATTAKLSELVTLRRRTWNRDSTTAAAAGTSTAGTHTHIYIYTNGKRAYSSSTRLIPLLHPSIQGDSWQNGAYHVTNAKQVVVSYDA